MQIYRASDVIDLHVDSFIWQRTLGYDIRKRHSAGFPPGFLWRQVDVPRICEAGVGGATWVVTTNPIREAQDRFETLLRNLRELTDLLEDVSDRVAIARNFCEYRAARDSGRHAAFIGIQGGSALDMDLSTLDRLPADLVLRVTLVHMTNSRIGSTSSPLKLADLGLSPFGRQLVERMNEKRILVDLAHISRRGFWDAVKAHEPRLPLIVTHTGVCGVHEHWRNLDDDQLRAVAESGGTIGVIYHSAFLGDRLWNGRAESIVRHIEHIVRVVGDDHASLGSDWDGSIVTPRDLPTCLELPRLVQIMLDRGWHGDRIGKILGGNFLRVLRAIRG